MLLINDGQGYSHSFRIGRLPGVKALDQIRQLHPNSGEAQLRCVTRIKVNVCSCVARRTLSRDESIVLEL
jgi:hypothetical protein